MRNGFLSLILVPYRKEVQRMRSGTRSVRRIFRRYVGEASPENGRVERELICLVTRISEYESIAGRMGLKTLATLIDEYYAAVAEEVAGCDGDVNQFAGPVVVVHYGVFTDIENSKAAQAAINLKSRLTALESRYALQVGVALCRGRTMYGRFGMPSRYTIAAVGSPIICAARLASYTDRVALCAALGAQLSPTFLSENDKVLKLRPHCSGPEESPPRRE